MDFRVMISLKNQLFDSPDLDKTNCIPVSELRRIRSEHVDARVKNNIGGSEDAVIKEIIVGSTGLVDLNKFSDLVDLYVYLPSKDRTLQGQTASPSIHYVLSSNMKDKATSDPISVPKE